MYKVTYVYAYDEGEGMDVECVEPIVATDMEFKCNASVKTGTVLTFIADFGNGENKSFPIAGNLLFIGLM